MGDKMSVTDMGDDSKSCLISWSLWEEQVEIGICVGWRVITGSTYNLPASDCIFSFSVIVARGFPVGSCTCVSQLSS